MTRRHTDKQRAAHQAARARIRAGEGFIYVVEFVGLDLLKIGFSLNPEKRTEQLFVEYHRKTPTRLLAKHRASLSDEMRLHGTLAKHRAYWQGEECYPRSILSHPAIPAELRSAP